MPIETLSKQEAAEQLRESLSDEVPALTNFIEGAANNQITEQGIGGFVERITHLGLAAQLSGWVDTAGGPITADKLETVGIEPSAVDIDLLQQYTNRSDLDALAEQNGVERDPGEFATGEVLFVTNTAETEIAAGTELYTGALIDGTRYGYQTTETVSPTGVQTNVTAPIEALSRGASSNVGSGSINTFYDRPTGVESVTNPDATSGGEDEESNASLRRRTRTALTRTSGGGTVRGIEGSIERAFDDVDLNDVLVVEHPGKSVPPYDDAPLNEQGDKAAISWGEVVVDSGATLSDLQEAVDEAKPSSIYHTATRPETLTVDLSATVLVDPAADVTAATVESNVAEYLSSLGLGEALRDGPLGAAIMDAASGVEDHDDLMVDVVGESYTYQSGTSDYPLQQMATTEGVDTLTAIVGGGETTLTEGTDYEVADTDSDGVPDTITFLSGGTSPDDGTDFDVSYGVSGDVEVSERGKIIAGAVAFTTEGL